MEHCAVRGIERSRCPGRPGHRLHRRNMAPPRKIAACARPCFDESRLPPDELPPSDRVLPSHIGAPAAKLRGESAPFAKRAILYPVTFVIKARKA